MEAAEGGAKGRERGRPGRLRGRSKQLKAVPLLLPVLFPRKEQIRLNGEKKHCCNTGKRTILGMFTPQISD